METCWMMMMLLLLLGCRSAQAARSPVTCKDVPTPVTVSVSVSCVNIKGEETSFSLLRGQRHVCMYAWPELTSTCTGDKVRRHGGEAGQFGGFVVTAAIDRIPVTYRCESTVIFPPPLKKLHGPPVTLQLVEGSECDPRGNKSDSARREMSGGQGSLWVWITAVGVLATYSVVATVLAAVSLAKRRTKDSYSDYMNTKPRAKADAHKSRGIQTQTHRQR